MMSAFEWWRSWHGAPMDHKYAVIANRAGVVPGVVSAIIWALLDYASQHKNRGSIEGFDTETYATFSGFPEDDIKAVLQALTDKEIIISGRFANWESRQPKREDDSTERVTRFRELKRSATQCNDTNNEACVTEAAAALPSTLLFSSSPPTSDSSLSFIPPTVEEKIYCAVTNHPTIPSGEIDSVLDRIAKIQRAKSLDLNGTIAYLRPFWFEQKKRYPGSTRAFWLDWAVIGEIPKPGGNGKKSTHDQLTEILEEQRRAELNGNANPGN